MKFKIKHKIILGIFLLVTIIAMIYDPYLAPAIIFHTVVGLGIGLTFDIKEITLEKKE